MLTDEKLIEMSRGVDSYLSTVAVKYEISPLSLAAVVVARAMIFNEEAGSSEDFLKLLSTIVKDPSLIRNETQVH